MFTGVPVLYWQTYHLGGLVAVDALAVQEEAQCRGSHALALRVCVEHPEQEGWARREKIVLRELRDSAFEPRSPHAEHGHTHTVNSQRPSIGLIKGALITYLSILVVFLTLK